MEYAGVLVGLGNPGPRYDGTRHNCGFALVSALLELAEREGRLSGLNGGKFSCELWRLHLPRLGGAWLAAMPQTFMNLSGQCVQPLLAWHKLKPEQLVVAHDELDIPAGELRFKRGGGNAGHNGLKSITELLGTPDFYRLRLGIGRPPTKARSSTGFWGDLTPKTPGSCAPLCPWPWIRFSPLRKRAWRPPCAWPARRTRPNGPKTQPKPRARTCRTDKIFETAF